MKRTYAGIAAGLVVLALAGGAGLYYYVTRVKHLSFHISKQARPALAQKDAGAAPLASGDFRFYTLEGKPGRLSEQKGKVVFVNRWGTWCVPCVAEMPSIVRLYAMYKDDPQVSFLLIASNDTEDDVRKFALRHDMRMPLYVTAPADTAGGAFAEFPSTTLYGKDGTVRLHKSGAADWSDASVVTQIEALKHE